MTHFHLPSYDGITAHHCNRIFCTLPLRHNTFAAATLDIQFNKNLAELRARDGLAQDAKPYIITDNVLETTQSSFSTMVLESSPEDSHREALHELAVLRNQMFCAEFAETLAPESVETLYPIFSYVTEHKTVYFFNRDSGSSLRTWNEKTHARFIFTKNVQDNGATIPVQKIPTVISKNLFKEN